MWIDQGNRSRKEHAPFMNQINSRVSQAVSEGYSECFKVTARGLYAISQSRYYRPEQVQLIDTCSFETGSSPIANATLYVIETSDGLKGTLLDGYGGSTDAYVSAFISEVEEIRSKIARHNKHEC